MKPNKINKILLLFGCAAAMTYATYLDYHVQDYARLIKSIPQVQIDSTSWHASYSRMPVVTNFEELPDSTQKTIMNYEDKGYRQVGTAIMLGITGFSTLGLYYLMKPSEGKQCNRT